MKRKREEDFDLRGKRDGVWRGNAIGVLVCCDLEVWFALVHDRISL